MSFSTLRTLLCGASAGALLAVGLAWAQEAPEGATAAPPVPPPHHRMHRAPIDVAQANERAARAFAQVDANADGQITQDELLAADGEHMMMGGHRKHRGRWAHMSAGKHADRSAETFAALDADGNGQLSAEEFARLREVHMAEMKKAGFARMDGNGDGVLSKDEFPPFTARLNALDTDHDGKVTRDEMRAGKRERFEKPSPIDAPATGADAPSENG